ncbi:MAG: asparaginase [Lachnospiraceae bacterium]|nr:asparaginase [Lachnospiraceae bacterium]
MKKKILMIGTGGTIAASPGDTGLVPNVESNQLLNVVPEIKDICDVDCIQPISLDSTNMRPGDWLILEREIEQNYDRYDGFVITHGTDTMAYTAAALSYLIQNSVKPIVLTGAQIPLMEKNTDAGRNIIDAFLYASDPDSHGVQIVFSGSVIIGTRARKNYTKRFDAFGSINFPEIARVQSGRILRFVQDNYEGDTVFYDYLNANVGLLKLVPGLNPKVMRYLLEHHDALVIESFGVGGLPEYSDFFKEIVNAAEKGKIVILTTQVPNEGSDIAVYRVGNSLKGIEAVFEAYDMTTEAAFVKTMWTLARTEDCRKAKTLFYKPVHHDILSV